MTTTIPDPHGYEVEWFNPKEDGYPPDEKMYSCILTWKLKAMSLEDYVKNVHKYYLKSYTPGSNSYDEVAYWGKVKAFK